MRCVQELRKEALLGVADRIELAVSALDELLERHGSYLMRETLAVRIVRKLQLPLITREVDIAGGKVTLALRKYE